MQRWLQEKGKGEWRWEMVARIEEENGDARCEMSARMERERCIYVWV